MLTPVERLTIVLFRLARDKVPVGVVETIIYEGEGRACALSQGKKPFGPFFSYEKMPTPDAPSAHLIEWASQAAERILGPVPADPPDHEEVAEVVNGLRDKGHLTDPSASLMYRYGPAPFDGTSDGRCSFRDRVRNFFRRT